MAWQPTTVLRIIRQFQTSTSPVLVETDAGQGFLKVLGNPEGPQCLVAEYVGTQLAEWFGLPTFDYALIDVTKEDEIPVGNGRADVGPAFITRKEDGDTWSGQAKQLNKLANPDVLPRLVVFDTWTLNCDRYSIKRSDGVARVRKNFRNVFLSTDSDDPGNVALRVMDHTHCFSCGRELSIKLAHLDTIRDPRVFGAFPQFAPYLKRETVSEAASNLLTLDSEWVRAVLAKVPSMWHLDTACRDALRDLIVRRAEFVAGTIEGKLFPQGSLLTDDSE